MLLELERRLNPVADFVSMGAAAAVAGSFKNSISLSSWELEEASIGTATLDTCAFVGFETKLPETDEA